MECDRKSRREENYYLEPFQVKVVRCQHQGEVYSITNSIAYHVLHHGQVRYMCTNLGRVDIFYFRCRIANTLILLWRYM